MAEPRSASFSIRPVREAADLVDPISLFYAYAAALGIDLAFQNFDAEMATMPGKYSPPMGELLLARNDEGVAIGCVGLRPLPSGNPSSKICEMKRLFVQPAGRGTGIGRRLASTIIATAQSLGYHEIRLDTLPTMIAALKMYRSLGFKDIPAYYDTPLENTHFLSLKLSKQDLPPDPETIAAGPS
jgi:ribosomal protein S18 acetylase RimI-like enzyme